MSLIYQALKQSEQQTTVSPSLVVRKAVAAPQAGNAPSPRMRNIVSLGVMVAAAGVLAGYLLTQGFAAPRNALASQQTALPSGTGTDTQAGTVAATIGMADRASPGTETKSLVPRADPPLPTAAPQPTPVVAYLPELKKAAAASAPAASAPALVTPPAKPIADAPVAALALSAQPTVAIASKTVEASTTPAATTQPSTEDVRALFDALNQALERQDKALAQTKLQGIQSQLAESSVARLRAESWFAHQTGDLDSASRIYRRLLEKMPGDELTSVNLASIEKKRQRPDEAKAVLAKALRQNPSSGVLRSAVEQLAQSEVRP